MMTSSSDPLLMNIMMFKFYIWKCSFVVWGKARTQSPATKNYAPELPTFGVIARVSTPECNGEPRPGGTAFMITVSPVPGKYEDFSHQNLPFEIYWTLLDKMFHIIQFYNQTKWHRRLRGGKFTSPSGTHLYILFQ